MFANTEDKSYLEKWYLMKNGRRHPFTYYLIPCTMVLAFSRVLEHIKQNMDAAIFRLQDHTDRLFEAASKLGIKIPYSPDELNQVQKGYFYKK